MGHSRRLFCLFVSFRQLEVNGLCSLQILPTTCFEPRTSGIGSNRSANWATATLNIVTFRCMCVPRKDANEEKEVENVPFKNLFWGEEKIYFWVSCFRRKWKFFLSLSLSLSLSLCRGNMKMLSTAEQQQQQKIENWYLLSSSWNLSLLAPSRR